MEKEISCPVCRSKKINFFCEKNRHKIYNCLVCQAGFVWPIPADLAEIYGTSYFKDGSAGSQANKFGYTDYEEDKKAMRDTFLIYLNKISGLTAGRKIFDVGAATGYFLDLARLAGYRTNGLEISDYAGKAAQAKGHNIFLGNLADLEIKEKYDVITMWDVLEHLGDPEKYLKSLSNLLDQKGLLAINTIDRRSYWARLMGKNWHAILPPEHIFYYSPKSLRLLLEQSDFEILEQSKIGKKLTLPYIFKVFANRYNLPILAKISDFFNKFGLRIGLPVNLRDNIFIIARKK